MELSEVIAELKKQKGADVVRELEKELNAEVFQPIFRKGHSSKTAEVESEIKAKDEEIKTLKKTAEKAESKVEELQKNTPDAEKVRADYEEKLQAKDAEWQKKLDDASNALQGERGSTDEAALRSVLLAQKLDKDWVDTQVFKLLNVDKRVKRDPDGNRKVLQKDGATPIPEAEGKTPLEILAAEIQGSAPDWAKQSGVTPGGPGSHSEPGSGGSFDAIRKAEKERIEARQKQAQQSPAELLGMTPANST